MAKRLEWSTELIAKFWDGVADTPLGSQISFAGSSASAVADIAARFVAPDATCLDFGGGNGELCEELLDRGHRAGVLEPSAERGGIASHRLDGRAGFLGLNPATPPEGFDAVFCLEVFEHVPDLMMPAFLDQLTGLVKPGGILLLTTPHREDLDANGVYCPTCDTYFHRWQHLRSVTPEQVLAAFADRGFCCRWLGLVGFERPSQVARFARDGLRPSWWRRLARFARDRLALPLPGTPKPVLAGIRAVDITIGSESSIVYVGQRYQEGENA